MLLDAGHYLGAYYLLGYAVECALKACVAKHVRRHDFPNKELAKAAYTHNLVSLRGTAGLNPDFDKERKANKPLERNWGVVKDWHETSRYSLSITEDDARGLYSACTSRGSGVLPWIRKRW